MFSRYWKSSVLLYFRIKFFRRELLYAESMDRPLAIAFTELKRVPYARHMHVRALYACMNSGLRHTAHGTPHKSQACTPDARITHACCMQHTRLILIRWPNAWKPHAFLHATGIACVAWTQAHGTQAHHTHAVCTNKACNTSYCTQIKPNKCARRQKKYFIFLHSFGNHQ